MVYTVSILDYLSLLMKLKNIYFKLIGVFELHVYIECILRVDADLHESINLIKLINSFRLMSPQQECAIAKIGYYPRGYWQ